MQFDCKIHNRIQIHYKIKNEKSEKIQNQYFFLKFFEKKS